MCVAPLLFQWQFILIPSPALDIISSKSPSRSARVFLPYIITIRVCRVARVAGCVPPEIRCAPQPTVYSEGIKTEFYKLRRLQWNRLAGVRVTAHFLQKRLTKLQLNASFVPFYFLISLGGVSLTNYTKSPFYGWFRDITFAVKMYKLDCRHFWLQVWEINNLKKLKYTLTFHM